MSFMYRNGSGELTQWPEHIFGREELYKLEEFLNSRSVIPLIDAARSGVRDDTIAVRHDVDHSISWAYKFAKWEFSRGYRSSYYVLHTAWYYETDLPKTMSYAREIQYMGHEVGFHNDSVGLTKKQLGSQYKASVAARCMINELDRWREKGFPMLGCADHGSGHGELVNQFWKEYVPQDFGFVYEAYQLMRGNNYISDNQGIWRAPLQHVEGKQTHMLVHPCHWDLDGKA